MSQPALKHILEAALMAVGGTLSLERMQTLFDETNPPSFGQLREALKQLSDDLSERGVELVEVASGYRLQVRSELAPWVARLWEERPQRYSRALLETLALIAYRQPITRGDIEDVRGVVVSSSIIRTLVEREWVKVVGYRDVPGRPAMYATTKEFLDYFGLKSLDELPSLMAIRELDDVNRRLELGDDAEARVEPAKDYEFRSDEDVAARGEEVLAETEDDLATAAQLLAKVESNLFGRDDNEQAEESGGLTGFGELLSRMENRAPTPTKDEADLASPITDKDERYE